MIIVFACLFSSSFSHQAVAQTSTGSSLTAVINYVRISTNTPDTVVCSGEYIRFTSINSVYRDSVSNTNSQPSSRRWTFPKPDTVFGVPSNTTILSPVAQFNNEGDTAITVTVYLEVFFGSSPVLSNRDSVRITINPAPDAAFTVSDSVICSEIDIRQIDITEPQRTSYGYRTTFLPPATPLTKYDPTFTLPYPATFDVTLSVIDSISGCQTISPPTQVRAKPTPAPEFVLDGAFGCVPLDIEFTNTTSLNFIPSHDSIDYRWVVGDTSTMPLVPPLLDVVTFEPNNLTVIVPGILDVFLFATADGCTGLQTSSLFAGTPIEVSLTAEDTVCPATLDTLIINTFNPNNFSNIRYDWLIPGADVVAIPSPSKDTIRVVRWFNTGRQEFYITTSVSDCENTDTLEVYVHPRVNISVTESPDTLNCAGANVTLTTSPLNVNRLDYYFIIGTADSLFGNTIFTGNDNTYLITNLRADSLYTYGVIDSTGCFFDSTDILRVLPPDTITLTANPVIGCVGDSVTFTATVTDTVLLVRQYEFILNGVIAQTGPDSIFVVDSIKNGDIVIVNFINYCEDTLSDTLVQPTFDYPIPAFDILVNSMVEDDTLCQFNTFCFDNNSTNVDAGTVYIWSIDAIDTFSTNPSFDTTLCSRFDTLGNYNIKLTVTTGNACTNSLTRNIFVQPTPPVPVIDTANTAGCAPLIVSFAGKNRSALSFDTTGVTYRWQISGGILDTTAYEPNPVSIASVGTYTVTVTAQYANTDCSRDTTFFINVGAPTTVSLSTTLLVDTVCPNTDVEFFAQAGAIINNFYYINDNSSITNDTLGRTLNANSSINTKILQLPTPGDNKVIVVADANGCQVRDTLDIFVLPDPSVTIFGPTEACIGETVTITASPTNFGDYTFEYIDTIPTPPFIVRDLVPNTTSASYTTPPFTPLGAILIITTIDTATGCISINDTVRFNTYLPINSVSLTVDTDTICQLDTVVLRATVQPTQPFVANAYTYSFFTIDQNDPLQTGTLVKSSLADSVRLQIDRDSRAFVIIESGACNDSLISDTITLNVVDTIAPIIPVCVIEPGSIFFTWNTQPEATYTVEVDPTFDGIFESPNQPGGVSHRELVPNGTAASIIVKGETGSPCNFMAISDTLTCLSCPVQDFTLAFDSVACTNGDSLILTMNNIARFSTGNFSFRIRDNRTPRFDVTIVNDSIIGYSFPVGRSSVTFTVDLIDDSAATCIETRTITYSRPLPITYAITPNVCSGASATVTVNPATYNPYSFYQHTTLPNDSTLLQTGPSNVYVINPLTGNFIISATGVEPGTNCFVVGNTTYCNTRQPSRYHQPHFVRYLYPLAGQRNL